MAVKLLEVSSRDRCRDHLGIRFLSVIQHHNHLDGLQPMVPEERVSTEWQMYSMEEEKKNASI